MRTNTELAAIGIAAVYLAFFSWPVPRIIKDIFHTGVGRFLGLIGVAYLAKQQSAALAIIAAIFYVKSTYAAYHENFDTKKDEKKPEAKKDSALPPATSGNVPAASGSTAHAQPASSGATEHFEAFSGF